MQNYEHKLLSIALNNKSKALDLISILDEHYFYGKISKIIFCILKKHLDNPEFREIPSLEIVEFYTKDIENKTSICQAFTTLKNINDIPESNFSFYISKIKELHNININKENCNKIQKILDSNKQESDSILEANSIIKEWATGIDKINKKSIYNEGLLKDSADNRFIKYSNIKNNPEEAMGIRTGFSYFDGKSNGLHPGEFMIIAGDTGSGKSTMLHNIGINAYVGNNDPLSGVSVGDSGHNVLYFSLEMPKYVIENRIDSCMAYVLYHNIKSGTLTDEEEAKYGQVLKFQKQHNKNFYIIDMPRGASPREIELKYLEVVDKYFIPELIIIDYFGIMSSNNENVSDWESLGKIAEEIHEFSRTYNISVISASQVNRPKDGRESYSTDRIARSSMVPQNANIVIQIGRDQNNDDVSTEMDVYITKMRDGGKSRFILQKDFSRMKIWDENKKNLMDLDDDI